MELKDYLIDQDDLDWIELLSPWKWRLPEEDFRVLMVNQFGDLFFVFPDETIQLLDVSSGGIKQVAQSADDFAIQIQDEANFRDWLLRPLVDQCRAAGMMLDPGETYRFHAPPVLGGDYDLDNIGVTTLDAHYAFLGQLHEQLKDVPDGTAVRIGLDDVGEESD